MDIRILAQLLNYPNAVNATAIANIAVRKPAVGADGTVYEVLRQAIPAVGTRMRQLE